MAAPRTPAAPYVIPVAIAAFEVEVEAGLDDDVDEPLALAVEPDAAGVVAGVVAAGVAALADPAELLPAAGALPEVAAPPFKQLPSPPG